MSSFERKLKRQQLKNQIGSNKIKDIFHEKNDTLEQQLKRLKKK